MKLSSKIKFVFKLASLAFCFLFLVFYKIIPAFSSSPYTASDVIGQGSFSQNTSDNLNPNQNGFNSPYGVSLDNVNHRLWVIDRSNSRILGFNLGADNTPIDDTADYVFGQGGNLNTGYANNPDTGDASADTFSQPEGITLDNVNHRLWVSDTNNSRVLGFNLNSGGAPTDTTADYVFGQGGIFTTDGWSSSTSQTLGQPQGMALDPVNHYLYVADQTSNRVIGFNLNSSNLPDNDVADYVFGQNSDFNLGNQNGRSSPNTVGFNGPNSTTMDTVNHRMFVSDTNNNRILIFNLDSNNNFLDKIADAVIGQDNFSSNDFCSTVSASYLCSPSDIVLDSVNHRLWVVDQGYVRVLQYNLDETNFPLDKDADAVLGQGLFASSESDVLNFNNNNTASGDRSLNNVFGLALDITNHRLYVSDFGNSRVVFFNLDSSNSAIDNVIDGVIGQPDLDDLSNQCNLGASTDINTLCEPQGLSIDQENLRLFVSDKDNNRVLVFDINPDTFTNGEDASYILGQLDQFGGNANQGGAVSQSSLRRVRGLFYNPSTGRLYIVDERNNRIVSYNVNPLNISTGMNAEAVLGSEDFSTTSEQTSNHEFATPYGVFVNTLSNKVYVADQSNNRVVEFSLVHITKESLMNGTQGSSYADTVTSSSSQGSVSYSITSGSLPDGLSINSSTGAISGTPSSPGNFTFTVSAIDDNGAVGNFVDNKSYTVNIAFSGGGSVPVYILQLMSNAMQNKTEIPGIKIDSSPEEIKNVDQTIENISTVKKFAEFLRISNKKNDVKDLQIFLNSQGYFVSKSGPGSPGNETNFFGRKTKAALAKYQEAHKDEILKPLNLKKGTGFFGPYTMRFVNAILEKQN